jgi:hypothetical protein
MRLSTPDEIQSSAYRRQVRVVADFRLQVLLASVLGAAHVAVSLDSTESRLFPEGSDD